LSGLSCAHPVRRGKTSKPAEKIMAIDNARSLTLIRKLDRALATRDAKLPPERVHQIRTSARRLEALLETLGDDSNRQQRKLRKRLKRLRRVAGSVRDVDVQMVALRKLNIGREQERKAALMQALSEMRGKREQALAEALDEKDARKVRKGLRRWRQEISDASEGSKGRTPELDAVGASLRKFSHLSRRVGGLTAENLHAYRTRCKRIRYLAEIGGTTAEAKRVVEPLKQIQDAIGDWHDWLTLTETAESLFARPLESGLVAALRNATNAKFVEARRVCQDARRSLLAQHRKMLKEARAQQASPIPKKAVAAAAGAGRAQVA
jgi:CHAD domain-containing protein